MKTKSNAIMGVILMFAALVPAMGQGLEATTSLPDGLYAVIETAKGTMVLELY